MLEVSQLDNTSAELPRKLLDISKIIRAEMEHLPVKEGVEYRLKLAAPEIVFPLHRSYVSLLVRELLKNAVKFTEQGSVTVKMRPDGIRYADLVGHRHGLRRGTRAGGKDFRSLLQGRSLLRRG